MNPVLRVDKLGKKYRLYANPRDRALEWLSLGRINRWRELWALRELSFEVERGQCLGVIGPNGAGKSTLLKILTGATMLTTGSYNVSGRVVSLLELGTGFNSVLSGRENIYESGRLIGLDEAELSRQEEHILAFADIGEYIDYPVRTYSTGMYVRLAFSIFAHSNPDVYLVDEALAVGDILFQQKCFTRFEELRKGGCAVVLVTHDPSAAVRCCDKIVVLNHGCAVFIGDPKEAIHRYYTLLHTRPDDVSTSPEDSNQPASTQGDETEAQLLTNIRRTVEASPTFANCSRDGNGGATILAGAMLRPNGTHANHVWCGEDLSIQCLFQVDRHIESPIVGIHIYDRMRVLVYATGTLHRGATLPPMSPGQTAWAEISFRANLTPGEYTVDLGVGEETAPTPNAGLVIDYIHAAWILVVSGPTSNDTIQPFYGMTDLSIDAKILPVPDSFRQ